MDHECDGCSRHFFSIWSAAWPLLPVYASGLARSRVGVAAFARGPDALGVVVDFANVHWPNSFWKCFPEFVTMSLLSPRSWFRRLVLTRFHIVGGVAPSGLLLESLRIVSNLPCQLWGRRQHLRRRK